MLTKAQEAVREISGQFHRKTVTTSALPPACGGA